MLAAVCLASAGDDASSKAARKRAAAEAVRQVAEQLGNTPAVCRTSYIYPRVIDEFLAGVTIAGSLEGIDVDDLDDLQMQERVEEAVLALIEGEPLKPPKVA